MAKSSLAEVIKTADEMVANTISVVPLLPGRKHTEAGPQRVIDDPNEVWSACDAFNHRNGGVGVAMWLPYAPVVVIGIDSYKAKADAAVGTLRSLGISKDLSCWAWRTGRGGLAMAFLRPDCELKRIIEPDGLPIDLLAAGQAVIPPSSSEREKDGGASYRWLPNRSPWQIPLAEVAELPPLVTAWWQGLQERRQQQPGNPQQDFSWVSDALRGLASGNRNNTLTRVAGKLRHDHWSEVDILTFLEPHALGCGLSLRELQAIVTSVVKYPQGQPQQGGLGAIAV